MSDKPSPQLAKAQSIRDQIISEARNTPELIAKAKRYDPKFAEQLIGKSLWQSKSPPVTILAAIIAWAASRYALGWDDETVNTVTFCVLAVVSYGMRYITASPINSIVVPPKPPNVPTT